MKLADLPRRVVMPLGEWPAKPVVDKNAKYARYREKNRALRRQRDRDYRARKAA